VRDGLGQLRLHPPLLFVDAQAITSGHRGRADTTALYKATSPDLP
jgi:hypothetical protein